MKIYCASSDEVKLPACPRKEKSTVYTTKRIPLMCDDGTELIFEILTSKSAAMAFLYDMLSNYNFPMARGQAYLNMYLADRDAYIEDMLDWENYELNDDEVTYFETSNGYYELEHESLSGAIKAYKDIPNVSRLIQSTVFGAVMYGGYIYYNEAYDDWEYNTELPPDENFEDYQWRKVGCTYIQVI